MLIKTATMLELLVYVKYNVRVTMLGLWWCMLIKTVTMLELLLYVN